MQFEKHFRILNFQAHLSFFFGGGGEGQYMYLDLSLNSASLLSHAVKIGVR